MSSLKWNKIVDFYNKYRLKPENEIQNLWEQLFADAELFGYSKMYGEIEPHRSIQIGSSGRVIPDIIIKNGEKDLYLDYYDMSMNWIDLTLYPHLHAQVRAEKPQNYNLMVEIAREL